MKRVNFIDAVNSGKVFECPNILYSGVKYQMQEGYLRFLGMHGDWVLSDSVRNIDFINAEFELEDKEITITESQFDEKLERFIMSSTHYASSYEQFKKERMGF